MGAVGGLGILVSNDSHFVVTLGQFTICLAANLAEVLFCKICVAIQEEDTIGTLIQQSKAQLEFIGEQTNTI